MNSGRANHLEQDHAVVVKRDLQELVDAIFSGSGWRGSGLVQAERINHEGRILGPMPVVTNAVVFNTPEADAIVSALQIFSARQTPWNEDISSRPVLTNSVSIITNITQELLAGRRTLRAFLRNEFRPRADKTSRRSGSLSSCTGVNPIHRPYPISTNMPVEGWPRETGTLTLDQWQRDINNDGGDRHSIIIQPNSDSVWETWLTQKNEFPLACGQWSPLQSEQQRPASRRLDIR